MGPEAWDKIRMIAAESIPASAPSELSALDALLHQYHRDRLPEQRERIASECEWLVLLCARRMKRRDEPFDDLAQVARIGLLEAIERFRPDFGVTFRTFASATIIGVLRRHYRSTWRLHVPRRTQELYLATSGAIEQLTGTLHRSPTVREIAEHLRVDEEHVLEAINAGANYAPLSLTARKSAEGIVHDLEQDLGALDPELESSDVRTQLRAALGQLPLRERTILYLRFFEDRTQSEIGALLGISQVHVSRLMSSALEALREQRLAAH